MDGSTLGIATTGDDNAEEAKNATRPGPSRSQPTDTCTICLSPITDRAVAVPCNHLTFDFLCLVAWLQQRSKCPLCNTEVSEVQYEFRGPENFSTYHPPKDNVPTKNESEYQYLRRRRGQDFVLRRGRRWEAERVTEDPALEWRGKVYRERLYALHVGVNDLSGYRDFTAVQFASSAELQTRARMFLRRELQAFTFLDAAPRGGNREFLLEYIVAVLRMHEIKGADGRAEDMLADYLGRENARTLLHELEAWLRSPFKKLDEWDARVQYAIPSLCTKATAN